MVAERDVQRHLSGLLLLVSLLAVQVSAAGGGLKLDASGEPENTLPMYDGDASTWAFWLMHLKHFMTGMGLLAFFSLKNMEFGTYDATDPAIKDNARLDTATKFFLEQARAYNMLVRVLPHSSGECCRAIQVAATGNFTNLLYVLTDTFEGAGIEAQKRAQDDFNKLKLTTIGGYHDFVAAYNTLYRKMGDLAPTGDVLLRTLQAKISASIIDPLHYSSGHPDMQTSHGLFKVLEGKHQTAVANAGGLTVLATQEKETRSCFRCGEKGHLSKDCPQKAKNYEAPPRRGAPWKTGHGQWKSNSNGRGRGRGRGGDSGRGRGKGRGGSRFSQFGNSRSVQCTYCHKYGHSQKNCRTKAREEKEETEAIEAQAQATQAQAYATVMAARLAPRQTMLSPAPNSGTTSGTPASSNTGPPSLAMPRFN